MMLAYAVFVVAVILPAALAVFRPPPEGAAPVPPPARYAAAPCSDCARTW